MDKAVGVLVCLRCVDDYSACSFFHHKTVVVVEALPGFKEGTGEVVTLFSSEKDWKVSVCRIPGKLYV